MTTTITTFEYLFFALFGLHKAQDLKQSENTHIDTEWTLVMFKIVFAIYLLVTVIVLINLLIAMMSDTYQRIQVRAHLVTACSSMLGMPNKYLVPLEPHQRPHPAPTGPITVEMPMGSHPTWGIAQPSGIFFNKKKLW